MRPASVLLALLLAAACAAEDAVVVNADVTATAISTSELRDIFLGRRTIWPNGQRIVVVLVKDGPGIADLAAALDKTPQQLLNWWKRLVFTGDGLMPSLVGSEKELMQRVAATSGAIGWTTGGGPLDGVRTLPLHDAP